MHGSRPCAIQGCKGNYKLSKYRFPNPKKHMDLLQKWVEICSNPQLMDMSSEVIYEKWRVCRRHFQDEDLNGVNRLQCLAVPTQNLPGWEPGDESINKTTTANGTEIKEEKETDDESESMVQKQSNEDGNITSTQIPKSDIVSSSTVGDNENEEISIMDEESSIGEITCRICLQKHKSKITMVSIFEVSLDDEIVADLLNQYASIKVTRQDPYMYICQTCLDEFAKVHIFIRKCQQADDSLQLSRNSNDIKRHKDIATQATPHSIVTSPKIKRDISNNDGVNPNDEKQNPNAPFYIDKEAIQQRMNGITPVRKTPLVSRLPVINNGSCVYATSLSVSEKQILQKIIRIHAKRNCLKKKRKFGHVPQSDKVSSDSAIKKRQLHNGPFICEYCSQSCASIQSLNRHIKVHTGDRPFVCEFCGLRYTCKIQLNHHLIRHRHQKKEKNHICEVCGMGYSYAHTLNIHRTLKHGKNSERIPRFQCRHCNSKFSSRARYGNHTRMEHIKLFANVKGATQGVYCVICNMFIKPSPYQDIFQNKEVYDNYIASNGFSWSCDICGRAFSTRDKLLKHRLAHRVKRYQCNICHRLFSEPSRLHMHISKHAEMISCLVCSRIFSARCYLERHVKTHSDSSPFKCTKCDKEFLHYISYESHYVEHTREEGGAACS